MTKKVSKSDKYARRFEFRDGIRTSSGYTFEAQNKNKQDEMPTTRQRQAETVFFYAHDVFGWLDTLSITKTMKLGRPWNVQISLIKCIIV